MTTSVRSITLAAGLALLASAAGAQTPSSSTQPPAASNSTSDAARPATTTFSGDTGLWYVPTAEVLGDRQWSVSGYRRGTN